MLQASCTLQLLFKARAQFFLQSISSISLQCFLFFSFFFFLCNAFILKLFRGQSLGQQSHFQVSKSEYETSLSYIFFANSALCLYPCLLCCYEADIQVQTPSSSFYVLIFGSELKATKFSNVNKGLVLNQLRPLTQNFTLSWKLLNNI